VTADETSFSVHIQVTSVAVIRNDFFPYHFRGVIAVNYSKIQIWKHFALFHNFGSFDTI
jgi:hypothetical protein